MTVEDRLKEFVPRANACAYFQLLDIEILEAGAGKSRVRVRIGDKHQNAIGTVHGGVYCSALDAAIWTACFSSLKGNESITTVEVKVNFLVPAKASEMVAEGSVVYAGKSILVGEAQITDPTGRLLAKGVGTCMVLPPRAVEGNAST